MPTANPTVNDGKCKLLIILLQFKGAQLLTEILYHTTLQENLSDNLSEQPQSTSNQMKCLLSLLYIVLLCIIFGWKIVFHIISCSVIGLVFVIFYVYLSMRYLWANILIFFEVCSVVYFSCNHSLIKLRLLLQITIYSNNFHSGRETCYEWFQIWNESTKNCAFIDVPS